MVKRVGQLSEFYPRHIQSPGREGLGFSFRCPLSTPNHSARYGRNHRLWVWYGWPDDMGEPNWDEVNNHVWHLGNIDDPDNFTAYSPPFSPIVFEGHFIGYVVEGVLFGETWAEPETASAS